MTIDFNPDELRPIIEAVVAETLTRLEAGRAQLDRSNRLAFTEQEAARLLDLEPRQLADERRRGKIAASQIVGRRIRYLRDDLVSYLLSRRWQKAE